MGEALQQDGGERAKGGELWYRSLGDARAYDAAMVGKPCKINE